jgi:hypothetical protein
MMEADGKDYFHLAEVYGARSSIAQVLPNLARVRGSLERAGYKSESQRVERMREELSALLTKLPE